MNRRGTAIACLASALAVTIAYGMAAHRKSPAEIEHDAYIWQRAWRTPLLESISVLVRDQS